MMDRILLVAAREFRQIAATRSFWVTLLILPLALAAGPLASRFLDRSDTERVMLIDRTGGEVGRAVAARIELDHQRRTLSALSRYVERHSLQRADPAAPWASRDRWYADAEVARFAAGGGLARALRGIDAVKPDDTPAFTPPERAFRIVPTPPAVASVQDRRLGAALEPLLRPADGSDAKPLDYALLIPAEFGRSPAVRLWSDDQPSASFVQTLQQVLERDLRARYLAANGVGGDTAAAATTLTPAIGVVAPKRGGGRERVFVRSVLPLALAYILLMSLLLSGSWLLQGSVEERSNKLLESVLACVSPRELMYGKLIGTVAIGLSMIVTWAACGVFAAYATQGAIADLIRPALAPVSSPGAIATILYFFVAGYVMLSMVFLVIGSTTDSMQDAQGYLTPVLLVIMLPVLFLVQAVISDAGGLGVQVLTWIPIWTPFAVLARLGAGMPAAEVIGAGVLLAVFIALEVVLLGRVFRASLLASGQRANVRGLLARMRRPA